MTLSDWTLCSRLLPTHEKLLIFVVDETVDFRVDVEESRYRIGGDTYHDKKFCVVYIGKDVRMENLSPTYECSEEFCRKFHKPLKSARFDFQFPVDILDIVFTVAGFPQDVLNGHFSVGRSALPCKTVGKFCKFTEGFVLA